jgi:hypothetical protein
MNNRSKRPARRSDGRIIGSFDGTTLRLKRKRSRHLVPCARCAGPLTSVCSSERLMRRIERVVVEDTESGEIYETTTR